MPLYIVKLKETYAGPRNREACVCAAANATDAREAAKSMFAETGDAWDADALVQLLDDTATIGTALALSDWTFELAVVEPAGGAVIAEVSVSASTIDLVGAALAAALNATPSIAGAAYVGATQTLTVADAADALGDHTIIRKFQPPVTGLAKGAEETHFEGLAASVTDGGAGGDALTLVFQADTYVVPFLWETFTTV